MQIFFYLKLKMFDDDDSISSAQSAYSQNSNFSQNNPEFKKLIVSNDIT